MQKSVAKETLSVMASAKKIGGNTMERIKLFFTAHWKQVSAFFLVLVLLLCSITVLANAFTNPQTYHKTIQSIDEKKLTVLGVSAAIAGSSTLLSAVPGDATSNLAKELLDLSSYLIVVVCILVLEKSLLTVFGAAACYVLLPVACLLTLIFIINNKKVLLSWAIKLSVLAMAFLLIVPCSMRLSDYIYEVNQVSFEQEAEDLAEDTEEDAESEEDVPWYKKLWNSVTSAVTETAEAAVEHGKKILNEFIDAVSVFIIAYCVIPVFVVFLFLWLLKILFGIDIKIKRDAVNPKRLLKGKDQPKLESLP